MAENTFYNHVARAQKFTPVSPNDLPPDQVTIGLAIMNQSPEDQKRLGPEPKPIEHRPVMPISN